MNQVKVNVLPLILIYNIPHIPTRLFQRVQQNLFVTFKDEFLILENQISSIEQCIQNDDVSLSEQSDEDATRHLAGLSDNVDTTEGLFDLNLSTLQKIILGFAAPVLVPIAVGKECNPIIYHPPH